MRALITCYKYHVDTTRDCVRLNVRIRHTTENVKMCVYCVMNRAYSPKKLLILSTVNDRNVHRIRYFTKNPSVFLASYLIIIFHNINICTDEP